MSEKVSDKKLVMEERIVIEQFTIQVDCPDNLHFLSLPGSQHPIPVRQYRRYVTTTRWMEVLLIGALLYLTYAIIRSMPNISTLTIKLLPAGELSDRDVTLHVVANGVGELYVDGRLITSWRRPCTLHRVRVPSTSLIAVYVDKTGDSAAFGLNVINASVLPSNQWRCVQQEAISDWTNPQFTDTSWPFAQASEEACPQLGEVSNVGDISWTHLTYTKHWNSVQLFCRTTLALS